MKTFTYQSSLVTSSFLQFRNAGDLKPRNKKEQTVLGDQASEIYPMYLIIIKIL